MNYTEIYKDLFTVDDSYYLAHCISSDADMGAGIAVQFRKRFPLKELQKSAKVKPLKVGSCIPVGRVLNLVTKKYCWGKPSYDNFTRAIEDMKRYALENGIEKIAMPQIGAGRDRLSWAKNSEIIQRVFSDTEIEILVCKIKKFWMK